MHVNCFGHMWVNRNVQIDLMYIYIQYYYTIPEFEHSCQNRKYNNKHNPNKTEIANFTHVNSHQQITPHTPKNNFQTQK